MRQTHIFSLTALVCFISYSTSSDACRFVLPGAASKSNEANFAYFDHVVLLQVISLAKETPNPAMGYGAREYMRLRVIKSFKGDLPQEFFVVHNAGDSCGQHLPDDSKFLAFFDARETAPKISADPNLLLLAISLVNFTASRVIHVGDEIEAEKIVKNLKRRSP